MRGIQPEQRKSRIGWSGLKDRRREGARQIANAFNCIDRSTMVRFNRLPPRVGELSVRVPAIFERLDPVGDSRPEVYPLI